MKFKVSIVIPVYNAEKYLDQCIESIINQDIGFNSVELILVNDGSKDGSGAICERYAVQYPDNIVYIAQKNAGVSEARNAGVKAATGEYVGFMDADDYFSKNTVRGVLEYFETAPKDVDVAIVRVVQFGHYTTERSINAKFNMGTRTLDLSSPEWYDVYPRVAPSFIKSSVAKRHSFHKEIGLYEDTRYIGEVLSRSMKLGVVSRGVYYNRIHVGDSNASITTGAAKERRFYKDPPLKVSLYLLEKFKGKGEYPPLLFQYTALYEMRWRMFYNSHNPKDILSKNEYATYEKVNKSILALISDEAIVGFELYNINQRIFLLSMKHDANIIKEATLNANNELEWRGLALFNYSEDISARVTDVYFSKDELVLEGVFSVPITDKMRINLRIDGDERPDLMAYHSPETTEEDPLLFDVSVHYGDSFTARIPVRRRIVQSVDFAFTMNDLECVVERLSLPSSFRFGHGFRGDYMIAKRVGGVMLYPLTTYLAIRWAMAKARYLLELIRRGLRKAKGICIQMIKMLR